MFIFIAKRKIIFQLLLPCIWMITIIETMLILIADARLHVWNWLKNLNIQNIYVRNKKADSFELVFPINFASVMQLCKKIVGLARIKSIIQWTINTFKSHLILLHIIMSGEVIRKPGYYKQVFTKGFFIKSE